MNNHRSSPIIAGIFLALLASCAQAEEAIQTEDQASEQTEESRRGCLSNEHTISVEIEGQLVTLLLDTGAGIPTISSKAISLAHKPVFETAHTHKDGNGNSREAHANYDVYYKVTNPFEVEFSGVALVMETSNFEVFGVDGVFPPQIFLGNRCLFLDYSEDTQDQSRIDVCPEDIGPDRWKLKMSSRRIGANLPQLFLDGVRFNGMEGNFIVDTGSGHSSIFLEEPPSNSAELPCRTTYASQGSAECVPILSPIEIEIGGIKQVIKEPLLRPHLGPDIDVAGLLGMDFLCGKSILLTESGEAHLILDR